MKLLELSLKNYRNYKSQSLHFQNGINVLLGKNAQGKTNLLEAVFLCSIGKSPRTTKDKDLIMWNESLSKISLTLQKNSGRKSITMLLSDKQNKTILLNDVAIKRVGELMGEFNSIYFSPDELKLVKESPEERRRFMDIDLSQFDKHYFYTLNKYNKILSQRNKLLKTTQSKKVLLDTLSIWNEQLATCASEIVVKRLHLMDQLKVHANNAMLFLTNNQEKMELTYTGTQNTNQSELKQQLLKAYDASLEKDHNLGYTTVGPHRDDFKIVVNGIDIRHFGSQGQQRTSALALKLAELEVFHAQIGEYPVLLLDDVLSELDQNRQEKLLQKVQGIQTIITGTHFDFDVPHTLFEVSHGSIQKTTKHQG